MPISEYDTLGSDSEVDGATGSQELVPFRHRMRGKLLRFPDFDHASIPSINCRWSGGFKLLIRNVTPIRQHGTKSLPLPKEQVQGRTSKQKTCPKQQRLLEPQRRDHLQHLARAQFQRPHPPTQQVLGPEPQGSHRHRVREGPQAKGTLQAQQRGVSDQRVAVCCLLIGYCFSGSLGF